MEQDTRPAGIEQDLGYLELARSQLDHNYYGGSSSHDDDNDDDDDG